MNPINERTAGMTAINQAASNKTSYKIHQNVSLSSFEASRGGKPPFYQRSAKIACWMPQNEYLRLFNRNGSFDRRNHVFRQQLHINRRA